MVSVCFDIYHFLRLGEFIANTVADIFSILRSWLLEQQKELAEVAVQFISQHTRPDFNSCDIQMMHRMKLLFLALAALLVGAIALWSRFSTPAPLDIESVNSLYADPAPTSNGPLKVLHLGHSLVGHDMPEMLTQLADNGHTYSSQIGWGTFMKAHWTPDVARNGFEESNTHPQFREGHEAIESGEYDVLVITEAVEIRDSIKYMESPKMLHNWAAKARKYNPQIRIYFYETWHNLDDPEGWLQRLDRDLEKYWEGEILYRALNYEADPQPIYVIPAGQVMAKFAREVEKRGGVGPIKTRADLFDDTIHFNDYGAYLIALTHYAVLYQTSPIGLPHNLKKASGASAANSGPEAARLMQEVVWEVVSHYNKTGVRGGA